MKKSFDGSSYREIADEEDAISLLTEGERKASLDNESLKQPKLNTFQTAVRTHHSLLWLLMSTLLVALAARPLHHSRRVIGAYISSSSLWSSHAQPPSKLSKISMSPSRFRSRRKHPLCRRRDFFEFRRVMLDQGARQERHDTRSMSTLGLSMNLASICMRQVFHGLTALNGSDAGLFNHCPSVRPGVLHQPKILSRCLSSCS